MIRKIVLSLFFLFYLFSITFGSDEDLLKNQNLFGDWIGIGLIIVVIHVSIVSLAYMYSNFISSDELKVWSKNEIMQAVYSILILVFFVGIFTFIGTISSHYFAQIIEASVDGPGGEDSLKSFCFDSGSNRWKDQESCESKHLKIESIGGGIQCVMNGKVDESCDPTFLMARSYLGISYERLANLHRMLLRNYALMMSLNTAGMSTGIQTNPQNSGSKVYGISGFMGFMQDGIYINIIESLLLFVEKILLMLKFQESVLKFMEYGLAFYLIVLGLIFRSIFIFRKFGGLLLSLGVCFMFILPLLYTLGWYTLSIPNIDVILDEKFEAGSTSITDNWIFTASTVSLVITIINRSIEAASVDKLVFAIIKTIFDTLIFTSQIVMYIEYDMYVNANNIDFYFTDYQEIGDAYSQPTMLEMGVFDYISRFLIIALALPLINLYIFFSFVRGLSPMLGGDAEIPVLARFL